MSNDEQAAHSRGFSRAVLVKSVLGVFLLAAIMASAIAWRVSGQVGMPGFPPVLAWQLAVWFPWVGYYFAIVYLARRIDAAQPVTPGRIALHVTAALLTAISHLAWYWQLSSYFSPFLGKPFTRFGVYPYFFIFWFLIDLLLYRVIMIVPTGAKRASPESNADRYTKQYAVRKGRAQHVVRTADITWIEAQGYYAGLHTGTDSFLIRKSLNALENELDPERFVRVHRSTIVNIEQVKEIQSDQSGAMTVTLLQGGDRNVSREGRRRLKDRLHSRGQVRRLQ